MPKKKKSKNSRKPRDRGKKEKQEEENKQMDSNDEICWVQRNKVFSFWLDNAISTANSRNVGQKSEQEWKKRLMDCDGMGMCDLFVV